MKNLRLSLALFCALSCVITPKLVFAQNGLAKFTLPTNAYKVGEIIAVYSKPEKVTIVWNPKLSFDDVSTVDIQESRVKTGEAKIKAKLDSVIKANVGANFSYKVEVNYTNARAQQPDGATLMAGLKKAWKAPENADAVAYVRQVKNTKGVIRRSTHLDVIEMIYIADINAEITDSKGANINLDVALLQKINASLGGVLAFSKTGKAKGLSLPVGYQTNPNMVDMLINSK
ncbi:MAG: hypothetical protein ACRYFZ_07770 [Janthinobacterium lividum]